jgi:hypothetical protein
VGDLRRARDLHEEGLEIRRKLGDPLDVAISTVNLGGVIGDYRDAVLGRQLIEEGLAIRRSLGDRRGIASALCLLAHLVGQDGDHAQARSLYAEGLAIAAFDAAWAEGPPLTREQASADALEGETAAT